MNACVVEANLCVQVCIPRHTQGSQKRELGVLFCQSPPYSFEAGSLTEPGAGLAIHKLHDPPVSVLDSTGVIGICMATAGFLCGGWGFELRSSYLCTNHSYALNYFPSPTFFFLISTVPLTNHYVHEPFTQTI